MMPGILGVILRRLSEDETTQQNKSEVVMKDYCTIEIKIPGFYQASSDFTVGIRRRFPIGMILMLKRDIAREPYQVDRYHHSSIRIGRNNPRTTTTIGIILRRLTEDEKTKNREDTQQVRTSGKRKATSAPAKRKRTAKTADPGT